MKKTLHLFAQLAKLDEAKREVWGVATAEMVDKEGEIFDYASSKPYFKAWSDEISKATDGKSLGNVREMHEPSAVGKLIDLTFDDELKAISVVAKIIDEQAWQKCLQGVYTGFSIGGQYVKAWKDGEYVRFTANPAEISVVDNPCVPGAHFTAVKLDGQYEIRKFADKPAAKSMFDVGQLAYLIDNISCIQECLEMEAFWEGDGSPIPEKLAAWISAGVKILKQLLDEEGAELTDQGKALRAAVKKLGKAGAKHSAETKAHHAAITKAISQISKASATATTHCNALMDKDVEDAAPVTMTKVPAVTEPKIETQESNMLEPQEKAILEKAAADSASSLSKFAEVEKAVNELKASQAEQAKGQEQIAASIGNLTKILGKMSGVDEATPAAQKVARTGATHLVTKEQDNGRENEFKELDPDDVAKLSPSKREAYTNELTKQALMNPQPIKETPGLYGSSRR